MTLEIIDSLIRKGEGIQTEFKEVQGGIPSNLYDSIVSFSNTEGGTIILGVDDDGNVLGLNESNLQQYISNIATSLNSPDCVNPSLFLSPTPFDHPKGKIIVIRVEKSSQVHKHAGRIYWRDGDADLDITDNDAKVSDLYFQKRLYFSENTIYPSLSLTELNDELFDEARIIIRGNNSNHPWLNVSNEQMLRESSLHYKDYQSGQEGLTLAAALIFGKDTTINNILPAYKIEAMVQKNNIDRYDDRITLRTNLIHTYLHLMEFIRKHLNEKFYLENDQRKDLRDLIFREVIGNLIVHREYTAAHSSDLIITRNDVIITNPNKSLFHGPLDLDNFSPYPKNPIIRRFFAAFGWTDEIGSGVRNTKKYMIQYVPGAEPLFIENDLFRTEIPLVYITMADHSDSLISWFELSEDSKDHVNDGLKKIRISPEYGTSWQEVLLHLVPSWHQKGTTLTALDWPKKQILTETTIQKVPGWDEKSTNLVHKKIRYLLSIIILTAHSIKLEQMMTWIRYSNRKTFRNNYLNPLQIIGFVQMTNPDLPSDPEQRYMLTEQGKMFLSGRHI